MSVLPITPAPAVARPPRPARSVHAEGVAFEGALSAAAQSPARGHAGSAHPIARPKSAGPSAALEKPVEPAARRAADSRETQSDETDAREQRDLAAGGQAGPARVAEVSQRKGGAPDESTPTDPAAIDANSAHAVTAPVVLVAMADPNRQLDPARGEDGLRRQEQPSPAEGVRTANRTGEDPSGTGVIAAVPTIVDAGSAKVPAAPAVQIPVAHAPSAHSVVETGERPGVQPGRGDWIQPDAADSFPGRAAAGVGLEPSVLGTFDASAQRADVVSREPLDSATAGVPDGAGDDRSAMRHASASRRSDGPGQAAAASALNAAIASALPAAGAGMSSVAPQDSRDRGAPVTSLPRPANSVGPAAETPVRDARSARAADIVMLSRGSTDGAPASGASESAQPRGGDRHGQPNGDQASADMLRRAHLFQHQPALQGLVTPFGVALDRAQPAIASAMRVPPTSELEQLGPQMIRQFQLQVTDGGGGVRLTLAPEHLGAVTLDMRVEQNRVSATISVENPAVREWIATHEQQLRDGLAGLGMALDELVVKDEDAADREAPRERVPAERPRRRRRREGDSVFELDA